jgi:hypothetical protein
MVVEEFVTNLPPPWIKGQGIFIEFWAQMDSHGADHHQPTSGDHVAYVREE